MKNIFTLFTLLALIGWSKGFAQTYVNETFDNSNSLNNWNITTTNNGGAATIVNNELQLHTVGGSDGYMGQSDNVLATANYSNLPTNYTNKEISFNLNEILIDSVNGQKMCLSDFFWLKQDDNNLLQIGLYGWYSGYHPDPNYSGGSYYNTWHGHCIEIKYRLNGGDWIYAYQNLNLPLQYQNYDFKVVNENGNWNVYYKEHSQTTYNVVNTNFNITNDLQLSAGVFSGDGGNTNINAAGTSSVDYFSVKQNQSVNLTSGLVAYYPFNGNANDESGNGNNGTVNGATLTADRFGKANSAYYFDMNTIVCSDNNLPNSNNQRTLAGWFFSTKQQGLLGYGGCTLISYGTASQDHHQHLGLMGDNIRYGSWGNDLDYSYNHPLGTWIFLLATFNGTNASIYLNGNLLITENKSSWNTILNGILNLGGGVEQGKIDDIRIYNRAINENEIQALYHEGEVNLTTSLVAYYPFNGNANDESGNGNNGTVNGQVNFNENVANFRSSQGDYISVNNSSSLQNLNAITMSLNVKPTSFDLGSWANAEALIDKNWGDNETNRYALIIRRNYNSGDGSASSFDSVFFEFSWGDQYIYSSKFTPNQWFHVLCTSDNNEMKIFINGILSESLMISPVSVSNTEPLYINSHTWWGGLTSNRFGGQIDNVRIYNRALNENEIQTLYLARTDQITVDAGPTVAPADTAIVNINTSMLVADDSLISYQCNVAYDATKLEYAGRTLVGTIASGGSALVNNSVAGQLTISYMTSNPLNGEGSILKLKFKTLDFGNSPIVVSDFLYNTSPVIDITNDTVFIADIIPPTANITFNDNDIRYGDGLVITADFSEAMLESNVVKIALSGAVTVAATNMTKVSATQYTYSYTIPITEGAVNIALSNGTDIAGNAVVATPLSGASFSIIGLTYGDVDDNQMIQAYDAALTLQYSVGIDPMPSVDPRPWEPWRYATANVDGLGDITANDAGLILQYSAGLITSFPVETKTFSEGNADVFISVENGFIVFRSSGELIGLNVFVNENKEALGTPLVMDENMIYAFNISADNYALGLATAYVPVENSVFMKIPYQTNSDLSVNFNMIINTETKSVSVVLTGIQGNTTLAAIRVYPNPANSRIQVSGLTKTEKYRISDITGNVVLSGETLNNSIIVENLKEGVYILEINNYRIRIVKE